MFEFWRVVGRFVTDGGFLRQLIERRRPSARLADVAEFRSLLRENRFCLSRWEVMELNRVLPRFTEPDVRDAAARTAAAWGDDHTADSGSMAFVGMCCIDRDHRNTAVAAAADPAALLRFASAENFSMAQQGAPQVARFLTTASSSDLRTIEDALWLIPVPGQPDRTTVCPNGLSANIFGNRYTHPNSFLVSLANELTAALAGEGPDGASLPPEPEGVALDVHLQGIIRDASPSPSGGVS